MAEWLTYITINLGNSGSIPVVGGIIFLWKFIFSNNTNSLSIQMKYFLN